MKSKLATYVLIAAMSNRIASAQSGADNATLQALLVEVRQLRLALERSTSVLPKLQLTLQRIQFQQDHVSRVSRQLEDLRNNMAHRASDDAGILGEIKVREAQLEKEQDAARRKVIEEELRILKAHGEQQAEQGRIQETQQRARESELAGSLQAEQGKLNELNLRLDTLERLLEPPQPKQP